MELARFLELDEGGLRRFVERRLSRLERLAEQLDAVEDETGRALAERIRERRAALLGYGRELGPYAYRLDGVEGLRLFALGAELEALDVRDELRDVLAYFEEIDRLPETSSAQ
jgi:hypothetical protein